jgi:hypothetical protein
MVKTGRIVGGGVYQSSNALLGVAVIHLLPGLLYWSLNGFNFDIDDWIYSGGCALFVLMAIWARWSPLIPSLISAALYSILVFLQLRNVGNWNLIIWIINVSILSLIGIAVYSAFTQRRREPSALTQN